MKSIDTKVRSESGLHARPAADFARTAADFTSTVRIENLSRAGSPVDARSLIALLTAGVEKGHVVRIVANGPDEDEAVEALRAILAGQPETVAE